MIRCITFGVLSLLVFYAATEFGLLSGGQPIMTSTGLILVAMLTAFHLCEQGRFAGYLTEVSDETTHLTWPKRPQILHAAKIAVSFMAILAVALTCLDLLISLSLELIYR